MPKLEGLTEDTAARAKRMLHEDQVSPLVEYAKQKLSQKSWALYHAQDYALGVLQLLESMHLLRDAPAEQKAAEDHIAMLRAFGAARTDRETAYRQLALQVATWSGVPGAIERLKLIEQARDDEGTGSSPADSSPTSCRS
jgi:hypothetical protein